MLKPELLTAAPVASARCSSGISIAASICGATLCMVLVHSTRKSAPAASTRPAAWARMAPAASQAPADCNRSIGSKSTL